MDSRDWVVLVVEKEKKKAFKSIDKSADVHTLLETIINKYNLLCFCLNTISGQLTVMQEVSESERLIFSFHL